MLNVHSTIIPFCGYRGGYQSLSLPTRHGDLLYIIHNRSNFLHLNLQFGQAAPATLLVVVKGAEGLWPRSHVMTPNPSCVTLLSPSQTNLRGVISGYKHEKKARRVSCVAYLELMLNANVPKLTNNQYII